MKEWIKIKRDKYGNAIDVKHIQEQLPILALRKTTTSNPERYKVIETASHMLYVRHCQVYTHYLPIPKLEV